MARGLPGGSAAPGLPGGEFAVIIGTMIYLDHNATTPLCPEARAAMLPLFGGTWGNASGIHASGRRTRAVIDDSRDRIGSLLGVKPHGVVFTGGGTESCNLALLGLARRHRAPGRDHLVTSATEHHAVLHAMRSLAQREGFRLTELPVDARGMIDPDRFSSALGPGTILASVMLANNETGVIQPIAEIAAICRERGVMLHTDAVQAFGKIPCHPGELGVDALSATAHKFYGPHGAGFLWIRPGLAIEAIQHGGYHENERRPGTENAAAIAGMAAAAERAVSEVSGGGESLRLAELRETLWTGIRRLFPGALRNAAGAPVVANTLSVSFPGCDGETILMGLDLEGVAVSSGSACMVGSILPSHVLLAMGVPEDAARATVRFSLGRETTDAEIARTIASAERVLARQTTR